MLPFIRPVDDIRYVVWGDLTDDIISNAETLAYTEETWNLPGTASIELRSYDAIELAGIAAWVVAINAMGLDEDQWNCHINHYTYFDWEDLEAEGVQVFYVALGWTETSWKEESGPPKSEDKDWSEFTVEEREAAEALCYRCELWDGSPLTTWGETCSASLQSKACSLVFVLVASTFAATAIW
jgi:hypothetical protein